MPPSLSSFVFKILCLNIYLILLEGKDAEVACGQRVRGNRQPDLRRHANLHICSSQRHEAHIWLLGSSALLQQPCTVFLKAAIEVGAPDQKLPAQLCANLPRATPRPAAVPSKSRANYGVEQTHDLISAIVFHSHPPCPTHGKISSGHFTQSKPIIL